MAHPFSIQRDDPDSSTPTPFFSIGITTYNRPDLLKQTLDSISAQTFSDFEAIVGNDYAEEPLSAERLGITDPRIRFENYPENLGEANNMNELLARSRGRYFTWQNDDDLYAPTFLEDVHAAVVACDSPPCIFTSYEMFDGPQPPPPVELASGTGTQYSGREFLRKYFLGELKAIGCTGVYSREYMDQVGPIEVLADHHRPLYTEYLWLIRAGLEGHVVYIDQPLMRYRMHGDAWGVVSTDHALYRQAGENLLSASIEILKKPELCADFRENIKDLLGFLANHFLFKCRQEGRLPGRLRALPYFLSLRRRLNVLRGSRFYRPSLIAWGRTGVRLVWCMGTEFGGIEDARVAWPLRFLRTLRFPLGKGRP
jgi:glycosyltransferase involved in cell wall biosynthesis